jgi:hypothetical protein
MLIHGKCHCGNIVVVLEWPGVPTDVVARECGCSFCVKHGGAWISNRDAKLSVSLRGATSFQGTCLELRPPHFTFVPDVEQSR